MYRALSCPRLLHDGPDPISFNSSIHRLSNEPITYHSQGSPVFDVHERASTIHQKLVDRDSHRPTCQQADEFRPWSQTDRQGGTSVMTDGPVNDMHLRLLVPRFHHQPLPGVSSPGPHPE
jgi:hypothetical protein